jgi:hypothetical protein
MASKAEIADQCLKQELKNYRLFNQYFKEYNEDCQHVERVWVVEGRDEIRTVQGDTIIHLASPTFRNTEVIKFKKSYSADWDDIIQDHKYFFGSIMRKWSLEENVQVIEALRKQSIPIVSKIDDFDQGRQAIKKLDEEGKYANIVLTSFINPYLKSMDGFVYWYKYGPRFKKDEEKGSAFIGTLRHMDVFGVPGIDQNLFLIYEKEKIGLNISPLRTCLETEWLLHVYEELNVWQIEPNSCVSITIL